MYTITNNDKKPLPLIGHVNTERTTQVYKEIDNLNRKIVKHKNLRTYLELIAYWHQIHGDLPISIESMRKEHEQICIGHFQNLFQNIVGEARKNFFVAYILRESNHLNIPQTILSIQSAYLNFYGESLEERFVSNYCNLLNRYVVKGEPQEYLSDKTTFDEIFPPEEEELVEEIIKTKPVEEYDVLSLFEFHLPKGKLPTDFVTKQFREIKDFVLVATKETMKVNIQKTPEPSFTLDQLANYIKETLDIEFDIWGLSKDNTKLGYPLFKRILSRVLRDWKVDGFLTDCRRKNERTGKWVGRNSFRFTNEGELKYRYLLDSFKKSENSVWKVITEDSNEVELPEEVQTESKEELEYQEEILLEVQTQPRNPQNPDKDLYNPTLQGNTEEYLASRKEEEMEDLEKDLNLDFKEVVELNQELGAHFDKDYLATISSTEEDNLDDLPEDIPNSHFEINNVPPPKSKPVQEMRTSNSTEEFSLAIKTSDKERELQEKLDQALDFLEEKGLLREFIKTIF